MLNNPVISVTGLGYVGLPVALAFAKKFKVIGFDISESRVSELKNGFDRTNQFSKDEVSSSKIAFTNNVQDLCGASFHIIAVPTPVTKAKQPDLMAVLKASEAIGKILKPGDIVVYESTVYPGVTEEECLPVLENFSALRGGIDFKVGYSPERINPGDKNHTFEKIKKVVSAQDTESLERVASLYEAVVTAGVHRVSSIKVAEAAKVIENTQRDLNIALMNELAIIFDLMNIPTQEVLSAAATKWNFIKFSPGLVGGHCIGVDPYYLTYKAEELGYHPEVILAGRRTNDGMGRFIAQKAVKALSLHGHSIRDSVVTVLGLSFKENCPDIRNTRVIDIISELKEFGIETQVYDPLVDAREAQHEYGIHMTAFSDLKPSSCVIVAVAHEQFRELSANDFCRMMPFNPILIDVKSTYPQEQLEKAGIRVWRL